MGILFTTPELISLKNFLHVARILYLDLLGRPFLSSSRNHLRLQIPFGWQWSVQGDWGIFKVIKKSYHKMDIPPLTTVTG